MKSEVARRRIESFSQSFGEAHLYLAYHAAFPLALTPDLLYRLWANFQRDIHGELLNIPWLAVADLLLSSLCDEVGYELYEMDKAVRNLLLRELQDNSRFGKQRIYELSDFLLTYVREQLESHDPDIRDFAQAQRWTALAYTKPSEAVQELRSALLRLKVEEKAELIRIASLIETIAEPIVEAGFEPLLSYVRRVKEMVSNRSRDLTVAEIQQQFYFPLISDSSTSQEEITSTRDSEDQIESFITFDINPLNHITKQILQSIILAQDECLKMGHKFLGTEQILLGLIRENTGIAAKVLQSGGVNLKDTRIKVEEVIGRGSGFVPSEFFFTPRVKQVLQLSLEESYQLGDNYFGTKHLVLGLIRSGEGVAIRVLELLNIDISTLTNKVLESLDTEEIIDNFDLVDINLLEIRNKLISVIGTQEDIESIQPSEILTVDEDIKPAESSTQIQPGEVIEEIDNELSQRHIDLDPGGYFIIYVDRIESLIYARHFTNVMDKRGLVVDPETGKVIPAKGKVERTQVTVFSGKTAKELCVNIFEKTQPCPVTQLDHAAYLGREFMRCELALITGQEYIQD